LGIAIGVAAIVAVLGLSSSASAGLLHEISALGTNLLVVDNGQTLTGGTAELPKTAPAMIARIEAVTQVEPTGTVSGNVYRNPLIPSIDTNALSIEAASLGLLRTIGTTVAQGSYLNAATAQEPVAVLGAAAAQRLGIDRVYSGERIWADHMRLYVAGILKPAVLAPGIDSSVLIGFPAAEHYLSFDGHPGEVDVSQPPAALVAQADAQGAFDDLFLGLGAVALLVGAVGVANIMIISVLERRSEIGLRRALGATRGHIRVQFLAEAVLLALIGGAAGVGVGALATAVYASTKHELVVIPALAWGSGIGAAILIGAVAGLWAALRAARMSPTQALWSM
jgi:putative ABC transport system permease protein